MGFSAKTEEKTEKEQFFEKQNLIFPPTSFIIAKDAKRQASTLMT